MPFDMRQMALAGAAIFAAMPAFAAIPPGVAPMDLSVFDAMPRVGEAQLATDPYCDIRDTLAISLVEDYAEDVVLTAHNDAGRRFDFWASDAFGTWTVSYTRADGIVCVIGSGTGWQEGASARAHMQQIGLDL